jgi:hypothetical protein
MGFRKTVKYKSHENSYPGSQVFACGQTGGRTDITKLIVTYHNFANAPKLSTFCRHIVFMCFCLSDNKQRLFPYTSLTDWSQLKNQVFRKVTLCREDFKVTGFVPSVALELHYNIVNEIMNDWHCPAFHL